MQVEVIGFPRLLLDMATHLIFSPLGLDYLLEQLTEVRETLSYICQFIMKDTIKGTNEQPDEKVHRVRSGSDQV